MTDETTTDTPDDDLEEVLGAISPVADRLLVLDFDGTLSPLVADPDDAALADGARDALAALTQVASVAILSGRPVDDLLPRLDDLDVVVCGDHGTLARTPDGERHELFDGSTAGATLDRVEAAVRELLPDDVGWYVERKPASLTVHSRRVDEPGLAHARATALLQTHVSDPPGWVVTEGKDVVEFRPASADKGTALGWLSDRHPARAPVVIGDDTTDEDAFEAAQLRGGLGVLVSEEHRATNARARLHSPARVVELLQRLVAD